MTVRFMTTTSRCALAIATLALVGCFGPKKADPQPADPKLPTQGTEQPNPTEPDKTTESTPAPAPGPLVTPKGQQGWSDAKKGALEVAKLADQSPKAMKEAFSQSELSFAIPVGNRLNLPSGQGKAVGVVRIQDGDQWTVQYMAIAEGMQGKAMRREGDKRFELVPGKNWDSGKSPKSPTSDYPASDLEFVEKWPLACTKWMHQPLLDGRSFWERTVKAWSSGVGGTKFTFEERPTKLGERTVTHYRLLAETEAKGEKRTIEAVIDGNRMVPVAVRCDWVDAGGQETRIAWQAFWAFGIQYEPGSLATLVHGIEDVQATQNGKR